MAFFTGETLQSGLHTLHYSRTTTQSCQAGFLLSERERERERGEIALVVCAAADGMSAPCVCAIQQQQFIKGEKGAAGVGLFSKQCIALL